MALNDLMAEVNAARGPLERIEDRRLAKEARDLESLKVGSEAFYKQQLGLSEMAGRRPDVAMTKILQDPNMPKLEQFVKPGMSREEVRQGQQDFFNAKAVYVLDNYPQYADKLGFKGSDVRQATGEVDVTAKQAGTEAKTRRDIGEAQTFEQGLGAKGIEVTDNAMWEAENMLKERGKTSMFGGVAAGDVQSLAAYAMQLQQADAARGLREPRPMRDYMAQAYDQMYGQQQQIHGGTSLEQVVPGVPGTGPKGPVQGAVPGVPGTGEQPKTLREIDLTNPGMMR